jgi:hypothetical protein
VQALPRTQETPAQFEEPYEGFLRNQRAVLTAGSHTPNILVRGAGCVVAGGLFLPFGYLTTIAFRVAGLSTPGIVTIGCPPG